MPENEATNAGLAALLGLSERRVAAVRGEGRLPVTATGRIDLVELLHRGWTESLTRRAPSPPPPAGGLGGLEPALKHRDPLDCGAALGALAALYSAPLCGALAAAEAGCTKAQAETIGDRVLLLLWDRMNALADGLGMPDPAGTGAIEADKGVADWRAEVNWPALFPDRGRSRRPDRRQTGAGR